MRIDRDVRRAPRRRSAARLPARRRAGGGGHGDEVVAPIAALAPAFATVVATQDWHPPGHVSFASAHPGAPAVRDAGAPAGAAGALARPLRPRHARRGAPPGAPRRTRSRSCSARARAARSTRTAPSARTSARTAGGRRPGSAPGSPPAASGALFVCGLARDFCVRASAVDAAAEGLEAVVLDDLTRAGLPGAPRRRRTRPSPRRACACRERGPRPRARRAEPAGVCAARACAERTGEASMRALVYEGPYRVRVREKPDPAHRAPATTSCSASPARRSAARTCTCSTASCRTRGSARPSATSSPGWSRRSAPAVRTLDARRPGGRCRSTSRAAPASSAGAGCTATASRRTPRTSSPRGVFGYSHTTGGYDGGQAEYVRVPFADVGPMKIPDDLDDEDVLLLIGRPADRLPGRGDGRRRRRATRWPCSAAGRSGSSRRAPPGCSAPLA